MNQHLLKMYQFNSSSCNSTTLIHKKKMIGKCAFFSGVLGPVLCSNFRWRFIYPVDASGLCTASGTLLAMITDCVKGSNSELELLKQHKTNWHSFMGKFLLSSFAELVFVLEILLSDVKFT